MMNTLRRAHNCRGECWVARAVGVPTDSAVGEWVDMVWRTHVRNGRRMYPITGARDHALGSVGVLQSPLECPSVSAENAVGCSQSTTPSHWLWLKEADVRLVLHAVGIRQLRVGLHCHMQGRRRRKLRLGLSLITA